MPYSGRRAVSYKEVRVPKAPLLACLTCPLCSYLVRDATTISECLHTFCRDCIHAELSNGESECCPMCNVSLGTLPLEKLRVDHQLNGLKAKLFPSSNVRKRKLGQATGSPGSSTSTRRKERSLYSLGVKESPALTNPGLASRKTRALPGTLDGSDFSSSDGELEEEDELDPSKDLSLPKTEPRAVSHNGPADEVKGSRRASPEHAEDEKIYSQTEPKRRSDDSAATPMNDVEHLRTSHAKPWTMSKLGRRLAQCSKYNRNNGVKASGSFAAPGDGVKNARASRKNHTSYRRAGETPEFSSALDALAACIEQAADADAARGEALGSGPPSPSKPALLAGAAGPCQRDTSNSVINKVVSQHREGPSGMSNGQSLHVQLRETFNGVMDRPSILRNTRPYSGPMVASPASRTSPNGIWFHLEAGDIQSNEDALPPLASPYVRIKDGKLPVFHVKKYLAQKLSHKVKCEKEVEITCRGQPVVSSLPLESIRDIWFSAQSVSDQGRTQVEALNAHANGSGPSDPPTSKDFLMVLTYRRHRKPRIC